MRAPEISRCACNVRAPEISQCACARNPTLHTTYTDIINASLTSSEFPQSWKEAEVFPLIKEGDHELPSNNCPLSLLIVVSKICEVVLRQFTTFLFHNERLTLHQSGNRRYHSSETLNVLVDVIILEALDQKSVTALILLDLSKAFDSVHHPTLLNKLRHIGAYPEVVKMFKSYLTGRSQFVHIGTPVSSSLHITHGVPQGANLSPLLFSIYVNELSLAPHHSSLKLYVDDSKMFMSFCVKDATDTKEYLQKDLSRVAKCCSELHLLINPEEKTKYLLIGMRQQSQNLPTDMCLNFLRETIRPVPSAKDLGLIRDTYMS